MAVAVLHVKFSERENTNALQNELTLLFYLTNRLKSASEADSTRLELLDFARQADMLSQLLRTVIRLTSASSPASMYDRLIRYIAADVAKNIERALTLVRKCKHKGLLRHVFLTTAADFKKVLNLLKNSVANLEWFISIFDVDEDDGPFPTMPPIANNEPILAWIWTSIALLHKNLESKDLVDAANELAALARNERYRKVIVQEGGVQPLLRLLKDGGGSEECQIAAAVALFWLVDEREMSCAVAAELGLGLAFPLIVQVLGNSSMKVQIAMAELVGRVAEVDFTAREEFGKENVFKPLVSCLLIGLDLEDSRRKERENESSEIKHELKTKCSLALWRLCKGSVLNCQKIAEPRGLICLAKIIEIERGELQLNCLMTIMEVAVVAEDHLDLRKTAWKPSSAPAKAVLNQLLRVIEEENSPDFRIPCIKAIGCLARIFPVKETGIISTLVNQLRRMDIYEATEAATALAKFACPSNHNCVAHSKKIIEFNGVPLIMEMLNANGNAKSKAIVLLCYLSINVENCKALAQAGALRTLNDAIHSGMAHTPDLREMLSRAMRHLMLYQDGLHLVSHSHPIV